MVFLCFFFACFLCCYVIFMCRIYFASFITIFVAVPCVLHHPIPSSYWWRLDELRSSGYTETLVTNGCCLFLVTVALNWLPVSHIVWWENTDIAYCINLLWTKKAYLLI